jgi:hypothetical protein
VATRQPKFPGFYAAVAPALIMMSFFEAVGLYALLQGAYRGDLVDIGLGLLLFTLGMYGLIRVLRGPYLPRGYQPGLASSHAKWCPTPQVSSRVWSQMIHGRPVAPEDGAAARYLLRKGVRRWHMPALVATIVYSTWWLASDFVAAGGIIGRPGRLMSEGWYFLLLVLGLWMCVRQIKLRRWARRFAPAETSHEI